MSGKQKLELTWIGKDQRARLEPRILVEDPALSYTDNSSRSVQANTNNILIHGDNLLALKALEQSHKGKVKCIFIDPPYNTGSAFADYDDGVEHSLWLSLLRERLVLLWELLSPDGSIWITIDDNECHYLKVLCDELFGRFNFISSMAWEKDKGRRGDTDISSAHDHILLYAKCGRNFRNTRNLLPRTADQVKRYKNPDDDPRGPWLQGDNGTAKSGSENARFVITLPSGRVVTPPSGNYWRFSRTTLQKALDENRVYFGKDGDRLPVIKRYLSDVQDGVVPRTWWPAEEAGSNQEAKRDHLRKLLPDVTPFATPKPERLLQRILTIATNKGDLVLDSFGGSGTTAAVAHKMGREWILVELENSCRTHIIPRLRKVIDGEDPGGITEAVGWKGGGGFRYYKLGPSLITQDEWGREIIAPEYRQNTAMLIEAMCKLHGYTFKPSDTHFWMHGQSTETDYIYVTTESLTKDQIEFIAQEVGDERSLLICCGSHRLKDTGQFANVTVSKIPKSVLEKCEWGKDDYSLKIRNLPLAEDVPEAIPEAEQEEAKAEKPKRKRGRPRKAKAGDPNQTSLFDAEAKEGKR